MVVAGHTQEVECLVTDGEKVVSSCLQGNIKVWDSQNGEIITNIDRSAYVSDTKYNSKLSTKPDAYSRVRVCRFFQLQKELYEKVNAKKNVVLEGENNSLLPLNTF